MTQLPPGVKMTPMLSQYTEWKALYPDCILFFRMGDFYEMFFDDARKASEILDITLTARDPSKSIPMAGVPWHAVNAYLGRLVRAGCKVAICEQIGEPDGKTLVDRQVIRIVTPGTFVPEDAGTGGRLAAVAGQARTLPLPCFRRRRGAWRPGSSPPARRRPWWLPSPRGKFSFRRISAFPEAFPCSPVFPISRPEEFFSPVSGTRWLADQWGVASLASFGVEDNSPPAGCAAAALKYFSETQFGAVNHVRRIYP